jgi:peroxiredoxin
MTALKSGVQAPDFSLSATPDQKVSLSDFRGKPVVLVFYPADWSPVCSDQLALYNELKPEFSEFEAQIIGISVDGVWCHLAFSKDRKLHFPLLADFEPKGAVARQYGVYREKDGEATWSTSAWMKDFSTFSASTQRSGSALKMCRRPSPWNYPDAC